MIAGKDFVFTGLQPWDIPIGSNAKDIALEISKHNRVLYVNAPLNKKTFHIKTSTPEFIQRRNVITKQIPPLRQIHENLWVLDYPFTIWPINFLKDGFIFDQANRINNKTLYNYVYKTLTTLGFNQYISFIDNDIYNSFYVKDFLRPELSIYYRRDNMTNGSKKAFWGKHAPRLEPLLCKKSDLVITNSELLAEKVKTYNPNTYNVGQGVNLCNYHTDFIRPCPQDMHTIKRPIIGYVGWITSRRLDAALLFEIAQKRPDYSFVFIGNEDSFFMGHPLHELPNVYFLGLKPQSETISYMANFDICINPQLINHNTDGNYPRKIDEYLALGKPTVATRTSAMKMFEGHVWNCVGAEEYLHALDSIINNPTDRQAKERIRFAHTHNWKNCVQEIYKYIRQTNEEICRIS